MLTVMAEKSVKILGADASDERVVVNLEPVPESGGKRLRLIATYTGDGKIGYRSESITVKTTSTISPELSIYLIIRNFNR
jgi:hypothetical protein